MSKDLDRRITRLEVDRQGASGDLQPPAFDEHREARRLIDRHHQLTSWRTLIATVKPDAEWPDHTPEERAFLGTCDDGELAKARAIIDRFERSQGRGRSEASNTAVWIEAAIASSEALTTRAWLDAAVASSETASAEAPAAENAGDDAEAPPVTEQPPPETGTDID